MRAGCCGDIVIQHHDFLPDFAGQPICELFDIVDCLEDYGIRGTLGVECSQLSDEREQFAAVIEVAGQLERCQRASG